MWVSHDCIFDQDESILQRHTVRGMNFLTATFFAFDAIAKMVANGVLFTPKAYFQVQPSSRATSISVLDDEGEHLVKSSDCPLRVDGPGSTSSSCSSTCCA